MSKRRDITMTVALCASLTAHAWIVGAAANWYVREYGLHIALPGFARAEEVSVESKSSVFVRPEMLLGQRDGSGNATDASLGDEEMQSRLVSDSQVQPSLSRDPAGPAKIGAPPSPSTAPPGEGGDGGTNIADARDEPDARGANEPERPLPFGAVALNDESDAALSRPVLRPTPAPSPPAPVVPTAPQISGRPGSRGAPVPPADVAPQGESESDPFTMIGSAEFRPGRTNVQLGRPHKLTRPRIDLAGQVDAFPLGGIRMELALRIDQTGKVVSVDIAHSSGSANIDQAVRVAAYEWWFLPKEDSSGKPRASESFAFGIVMH